MTLRQRFKKIMPEISKTEQEALDAGDVWLEASVFQGKPNFDALLNYPKNQLSDAESAFINGPLAELLDMIDDYELSTPKHVPEKIMTFLKDNRFFSFIIPKAFGGLEFSHYANSTIVAKIAAKSGPLSTLVIVPNSLGCGELIAHFGTVFQKNHYLPRLAYGKDIPCFALTSPEAGSDAGGIPDSAIVTTRIIDGKETLGLSCTWDKRYITLAPISTLLGLAVKVFDPESLLGKQYDLGITCVLVPTSLEGVQVGNRHDPMGTRFYNGTTRGTNVFVPIDNVIGGKSYIGKGWQMLMACLGAGRGVSIPAQAAGIIQGAFKTTSEYAFVREQFGTEIGNFEGVQEKLALMAGLAYTAEAMRNTVLTALDSGNKPSVLTAMTKFHMTEMSRIVLNAAMDVQAGKAIQSGPTNVLHSYYQTLPVCITVEGANILTRNLMIFGQGATRCHPHVKSLIDAIYADDSGADQRFNKILSKVVTYSVKNVARGFGHAWLPFTNSAFESDSTVKPVVKRIQRLSSILTTHIDFSLLIMGGDLKRKELLSARLGDAMSYLFMAMTTVRYYTFSDNKNEQQPWFEYSVKWCLKQAETALDEFNVNFPNRLVAKTLNVLTGKLWLGKTRIDDALITKLARETLKDSDIKAELTALVPSKANDGYDIIAQAFESKQKVLPVLDKLKLAIRTGTLHKKLFFQELIEDGLSENIISTAEYETLLVYNQKRKRAIAVDEFDFDINAVVTHDKC